MLLLRNAGHLCWPCLSLPRRTAVRQRLRPVARLLPFESTPARPVFGADRGRFVVPDDFDAPLPTEILADVER